MSRTLAALIAIAGLALATSPASAQRLGTSASKPEKATPAAKIGEKAPDFELRDAAGKAHRLADYQGRVVVLQWINPQCPVCKGCMTSGDVAGMLKELKKIDERIAYLPINSTHFMEADQTAAYLKKYEIDAPGLIDRDGTVGHLYGARTTPHLFVIDKAGVLRYDGAIDSKREKPQSEPMNYVVNAVRQISTGETVSPDKTRPYGCSVKYKKKKNKKS